ncbi:unnamed protein product [Clavelina lepadiformis]|uniref:glutathione transferase n=1 Tax=Clavelina lepadiformis TaxID=159417 RepID=A0ABP0FKV1_CLALP
MSKFILGYWDVRGFGEAIRYMLEYLEVDYEDRRYVAQGPPPKWEGSTFHPVRDSLGLDFPNVPYVIDGEVRMTQMSAIMKYISRRFNALAPRSEEQTRKCDMLDEVIRDFSIGFYLVCYEYEDFDVKKDKYFKETLPAIATQLERFLADSTWLIGDELTYVDFKACSFLDQILVMEPDCLNQYKTIKAYLKRFFALKAIAAYRNSNKFKKLPIASPFAKWGGQKEA